MSCHPHYSSDHKNVRQRRRREGGGRSLARRNRFKQFYIIRRLVRDKRITLITRLFAFGREIIYRNFNVSGRLFTFLNICYRNINKYIYIHTSNLVTNRKVGLEHFEQYFAVFRKVSITFRVLNDFKQDTPVNICICNVRSRRGYIQGSHSTYCALWRVVNGGGGQVESGGECIACSLPPRHS